MCSSDLVARDRDHIIVVRRALHDVARGAIIGRPLASGALSEDIAQTQEDEDGQRQEDDSVNIHVAFAFCSHAGNGSGGRAFPPLGNGSD